MAADRAQHVADVIGPALEAGRWVVTDRFSASTLAYQGFGRGLDSDELEALVGWATGGLRPDLTILFDLPVEVAAARRRGSAGPTTGWRPRASPSNSGWPTASAPWPPGNHDRWAVVDATGPVPTVATAVWDAVRVLVDAGGAR